MSCGATDGLPRDRARVVSAVPPRGAQGRGEGRRGWALDGDDLPLRPFARSNDLCQEVLKLMCLVPFEKILATKVCSRNDDTAIGGTANVLREHPLSS